MSVNGRNGRGLRAIFKKIDIDRLFFTELSLYHESTTKWRPHKMGRICYKEV